MICRALWAAVLSLWAQGALAQTLLVNGLPLSSSGALLQATLTQAATPTQSPGTGTYSSTQTGTISCASPSPTIYYTTDGSTPTTSSTVYSSALTISVTTTVKAICTASGYSQSAVGSAAYTISAGAMVFPQIGVQTNFGNQYYPTANLQQLAQYQYILMGGNYNSWPSLNGSNGGYSTRDQVVVAIKSYTGSGGKNAVVPQVIQYENPSEFDSTGPWWSDWYNAVNGNNWFAYNAFASGTKTESAYNNSFYVLDPANVVGTDTYDSTGLYPYALVATLLYQRYYLGTSSGGSAMASTHLDGYFLDNQSYRNLAATGADWERNGTNPSQTDPTAVAATAVGKAKYVTTLASLNSGLIAAANSEGGYDLSATGSGGLGINPSGLATIGIYPQGTQQFMYGNVSGASAVLNWGGFAVFMSWYQTLESSLASGGVPVLTGGFSTTDYQAVRYALTATLMRNGIFAVGYYTGSGPTEDETDPGSTSTYPQFDEFWGGNKNLAGYLGAASGAEQTAAYSNGVWCRQFVSGVACVNPTGNGTQTITLPGGPYYHLNGSQDHTHNPGGGAVTTDTIAAGDGDILTRTGPN